MLSVKDLNEIELIKSQNEGLKKQNTELQQENKKLIAEYTKLDTKYKYILDLAKQNADTSEYCMQELEDRLDIALQKIEELNKVINLSTRQKDKKSE